MINLIKSVPKMDFWKMQRFLTIAGVLMMAGSSKSQGQGGFYFSQQDNRFSPSFQPANQNGGASFFDQNSFGNQQQYRPSGPDFSSQQYQSGQQNFADSRFGSAGQRQQPAPFQSARSQPSGQFYINQADFQPEIQRPANALSATSFQFNHPAATVKPEYGRFVPQTSHNHDPSKPETFLGQITINNPDPFPENPIEIQNFNSARIRQPAHTSYNTNILRTPALNGVDFESGFHNAPENDNQDLFDYSDKNKPTTYNPGKVDFSSKIKPTNRIVFNSKPTFFNSPNKEDSEVIKKPSFTPSHESYFSSNENNFSNSRSRFKPKGTSTTTPHPQTERRNRFSPTVKSATKGPVFNLRNNKAGFSPNKPHYSSTTEYKPLFDLEPLLEDEIPNSKGFGDNLRPHSNGSEDVEVIKSVEISTNNPSTVESEITTQRISDVSKQATNESVKNETKEEKAEEEKFITTTEYLNESDLVESDAPSFKKQKQETEVKDEPAADPGVTEYYDEEVEYVDEVDGNGEEHHEEHNKKDLHKDEEEEIVEYEDEDVPASDAASTAEDGETFEVLTMKPKPTMVKDDNFKGFVDSALIDNTEPPSFVTELYVEPHEHVETTIENDATTTDPPSILLGEEVVSVVTTKSVVNGTYSVPEYTQPPPKSTAQMNASTQKPEASTVSDNMKSTQKQNVPNATESWVVVASVQTSRSVSGARFLPFPAVAQEETKQVISDSNEDKTEETDESKPTESHDLEAITTTEQYTTVPSVKTVYSTESIIDKLDRVQSELSSGFLSGGFKGTDQDFDVLTEMPHENMTRDDATSATPPLQIFTVKSTTSTSTTERATPEPLPVTIRKFSPYSRPASTTAKPKPKAIFDTIKMDDLTGLLPPGFKPRPSFKDRKITTTTEKTAREPSNKSTSTQGRSFTPNFKNKVIIQDDLSALLPKGYKPPKEEKTITIDDILKKIKPAEDLSNLLPPGYKNNETKPAAPTIKPFRSNKHVTKPDTVNISALLPKGYKSLTTSTAKPKTSVNPLLENAKPVVDITAFLPPGFKLDSAVETNKTLNPVVPKVQFADVSALLPPGFKLNKEETPTTVEEKTSTASSTTKQASGGFKVVFPSRPGAGKPGKRLTTPKPSNEGGSNHGGVQGVTVLKGWPTRATTEFTGWPTPSTTPFSIENLLEAQRAATATSPHSDTEPSEGTEAPVRAAASSTAPSTAAPIPTTPGICKEDCDLAATIKIVGGVKWVPELLDHNTKEWQLLANEVSRELDIAYSKNPSLKKWYKGVRIDAFSKGSVLVDYFVELNEVPERIDTVELKKLFHTSLNDARPGSVLEENPQDPDRLTARKVDEEFDPDAMLGDQPPEERNRSYQDLSKGKLEIGKFIVDPAYTEFIVLPKRMDPTVGFAEDNMLLPQWGIAVIVIALASLLFVVIFGVTVLVNRQKSAKAKQPIPLSEDMLRELDKSHMGGTDELFMHDHEPPYPPRNHKRNSTAMLDPLTYPGNPGDSWRSEWGPYYTQYHQQHYAPDSGRGSQTNTNYGYSGSQNYGYNGGGSQNYGYSGEGVRTLYPRRRSDFDSNF